MQGAQRRNVHVESHIDRFGALQFHNRDLPAEDRTHTAVVIQKAEDGFEWPPFGKGLRKRRENTVAVFWVDSLAEGGRLHLLLGVKTGQLLVVSITERHPQSFRHEDAERCVIDEASVLGLRCGQMSIQFLQCPL